MSEKCELQQPARCAHVYKDGTCRLIESCQYKPAALTPADPSRNARAEFYKGRQLNGEPAPSEKGPTCPKCGKVLIKDYSCGKDLRMCSNTHCDWQQPDSAQRPPYPAPREGYHAGEYRPAVKGVDAYYSGNGVNIYTPDQYHHDQPIPVWIAVKDAPVSEPVPIAFVLPTVAGRLSRMSNQDFERACLVHIERLQHGLGDYDSAMMDTFCEAVRMVREYSDRMQSPVLATPSPVKPVVEYIAAVSPYDYIWKVVDGQAVEAIRIRDGDVIPCSFPWIHNKDAYRNSTPAEYEAARKPAKPAIEPLDVLDSRVGSDWLVKEVLELKKRVAALEGGGK